MTKWDELSAWKIRPLDHMGGMTPFGALPTPDDYRLVDCCAPKLAVRASWVERVKPTLSSRSIARDSDGKKTPGQTFDELAGTTRDESRQRKR